MVDDEWLLNLVRDLREARSRSALMDVLERLEDHYDAFSGPGQELIDQLLDEGRRRLRSLG
ncbi:MAG: hypothetical protein FD187_3080 [bacterium]|nr:MAG: hypothetical protein FD142_3096 [bacterium]KAF0147059.1 MAG: hypothetical protein FD187_3080 [bacterium]KAF0164211.1 MAG: hypothetical protein FD158_3089 [bacterium]TXT16122.1 MAG: hypothetical protein FD132_2998 [bacterium]